nr:hypothetical protein CFP56_21000 [Quercus suber]
MHTDGDVDAVSSRHNDWADDEQELSSCSNHFTAKDIGEGTNEGTDCGKRDEVADNHPKVTSRGTTNITVDKGQNAAKQVERNLRTDPKERHSGQS